jgi:foldase protein PrsA
MVTSSLTANTPFPPDAVAMVDGVAISRAIFESMCRKALAQYADRFRIDLTSEQGKASEKELKLILLTQLVERQIILNEAARRRIDVPHARTNQKLTEIKNGFPTEESFVKALRDNSTSLDELKDRIRESLLSDAVQIAVTPHVVVTADDVKAYYTKNQSSYELPEEVRASHILLETKEKAHELIAKLKAGDDFGELAKTYSIDRGSAAHGGDLGFFAKGRMIPELEVVAFRLKPGQCSEPVKSQFGYHVIQVIDVHPARTQPLEEVQDEIRTRLDEERRASEFSQWLTNMKARATITYSADMAEFAPQPGDDHSDDQESVDD